MVSFIDLFKLYINSCVISLLFRVQLAFYSDIMIYLFCVIFSICFYYYFIFNIFINSWDLTVIDGNVLQYALETTLYFYSFFKHVFRCVLKKLVKNLNFLKTLRQKKKIRNTDFFFALEFSEHCIFFFFFFFFFFWLLVIGYWLCWLHLRVASIIYIQYSAYLRYLFRY